MRGSATYRALMAGGLKPTPTSPADALSKRPVDQNLLQGYLSGTIETRGPSQARRAIRPLPSGPYGGLQRLRTETQRAAAHERRRKRGGDGRLPHTIRAEYTEGQRAVLSVVGERVERTGRCDVPIDKLAALAGVCKRTAQYAIRRAQSLGHLAVLFRPRRGQPSLTNVLTITARSWLSWLRPKTKKARSIGCKGVHATKTDTDSIAGSRLNCPNSGNQELSNPSLRPEQRPQRAMKGKECREPAPNEPTERAVGRARP